MTQAALLGGVFIGILSALPVINVANCCCLWIVAGGMLAAYLDQQPPGQPRSIARGALDGLFAGAVGAFVWLMASLAIDVVMGPLQERLVSEVLQNASDMPPEVRAWLEGFTQNTTGVARYVIGFMFQLFIGLPFGALGGLLGGVFFWREGLPPALGGPQAPPPLP